MLEDRLLLGGAQIGADHQPAVDTVVDCARAQGVGVVGIIRIRVDERVRIRLEADEIVEAGVGPRGDQRCRLRARGLLPGLHADVDLVAPVAAVQERPAGREQERWRVVVDLKSALGDVGRSSELRPRPMVEAVERRGIVALQGQDVGRRRRSIGRRAGDQGVEGLDRRELARLALGIGEPRIGHEVASHLTAAIVVEIVARISLVVDPVLQPSERAHPAPAIARDSELRHRIVEEDLRRRSDLRLAREFVEVIQGVQ